jgi:hypothetical protein
MNLPASIHLPDGEGVVREWTHWDGSVNLSHQLQPDGTSIDTGISSLSLVRYNDGRLFRIPFPASLFFSLNENASDVVKKEGSIILEAIVRLHQHQFNEMGLNELGGVGP